MYAMAMSSDKARTASEMKRSEIERHCGVEGKRNRASIAEPGTESGRNLRMRRRIKWDIRKLMTNWRKTNNYMY